MFRGIRVNQVNQDLLELQDLLWKENVASSVLRVHRVRQVAHL